MGTVEHRNNVRYQTLARARIAGAGEGETLLRDISITGCCVECSAFIDVKPNVPYKLEVIPEGVAKVGVFDLTVEPVWMKNGGYSCEIGFSIVQSPHGGHFQRYVDYLAWRYAQGNSMTGAGLTVHPVEA